MIDDESIIIILLQKEVSTITLPWSRYQLVYTVQSKIINRFTNKISSSLPSKIKKKDVSMLHWRRVHPLFGTPSPPIPPTEISYLPAHQTRNPSTLYR
mmetsp:Transcript_11653/g.16506  ORF Transcript_11653/g.16506 Transcript_11653/m.16506 type:complete len:98 (+) Transcript_11653:3-296(+)